MARSKSSGDATARFIQKHFRAQEHHLQQHLTNLFIVYRACEALRTKLGDEGLRHWMQVSCPSIPWLRFEQLFDEARKTGVKDLARRIARN